MSKSDPNKMVVNGTAFAVAGGGTVVYRNNFRPVQGDILYTKDGADFTAVDFTYTGSVHEHELTFEDPLGGSVVVERHHDDVYVNGRRAYQATVRYDPSSVRPAPSAPKSQPQSFRGLFSVPRFPLD